MRNRRGVSQVGITADHEAKEKDTNVYAKATGLVYRPAHTVNLR